MTKEEILKAAEHCTIEYSGNCSGCPLSGKGCISIFTQYIINKENEPAPSSNDTSSNHKNTTTLDDTAKLEICQEKLLKIWGRNTDVLGHCIDICDMIHSVSEMIRTVLDVLNDLEKLGDTNAN